MTCSDCIDGFWGLDADGCKICVCDSAGTVPESFCHKTDGQCVCRKNVQGVQCDQCKDQFYNLTADNDLVSQTFCVNFCYNVYFDVTGTFSSVKQGIFKEFQYWDNYLKRALFDKKGHFASG